MNWRDVPLASLELSVRAERVLLKAGYRTLGQIANATKDELMGLEGMGRRTVSEIRAAVDRCTTSVEPRTCDVVAWALANEHLIRAVMAGQARIVGGS